MSNIAKTDSSTPSTYSSSNTTVTTYETGAATISTFDTQPIDEEQSQEDDSDDEVDPDAWGQLNVLGEKNSYSK